MTAKEINRSLYLSLEIPSPFSLMNLRACLRVWSLEQLGIGLRMYIWIEERLGFHIHGKIRQRKMFTSKQLRLTFKSYYGQTSPQSKETFLVLHKNHVFASMFEESHCSNNKGYELPSIACSVRETSIL